MPYTDPEKRRAYARQYNSDRRKHDPKFKADAYARRDRWKEKSSALREHIIAEFRANGCKHCPESTPCALDAHHRDPEHKDFSPGNAKNLGMSPDRLRIELAKCDCVCKNCHSKIHAGLLY